MVLEKPHRFYQWPRRRQNMFLALVALGYLFLPAFALLLLINGWWVGMLVFFILFIPAQFLDTPLGQRRGRFLYFAPLFLVEKRAADHFVLHGGTSFDYFFCFTWRDAGAKARRQLLADFVSGLQEFATYLAENGLEEAKIEGSSYFFSARNARRFGFSSRAADNGQRLILYVNYLVLLATYSFAQGRCARPPIHQLKTVQADGRDLIAAMHTIPGNRFINNLRKENDQSAE
jgi:hypothetical protein